MKGLTKKSEMSPIESLRREMDRIFDEIVPFSWRRDFDEFNGGLWAPATDLKETEDEYRITVDLPGIKKDEVKITFKDNRLTISGERYKEEEEKEEDFLRHERYTGKFVRSFTLPAGVKEDKIKARFKDGVLSVTVPKSEAKKPKVVEID